MTIPTSDNLLDALFDTIDGNDYDDGLEGWWSSVSLGDDLYQITFSNEEKVIAKWEVRISIEEVPAG